MLKAVFLDLDNTLIDFTTIRRQAYVVSASIIVSYYPGLPKDKLIKVSRQKTGEVYREFISGQIDYDTQREERFKRVLAEFGIRDLALTEYLAWFFNNFQEVNVKPYKGVQATLKCLSQKYKLYVITNGPYSHQIRKLKRAKLSPYIEKLYAPGDGKKGKPEPHLFYQAMRESCLKPYQVVHVGDEIADIKGAQNSNIEPIWINPPTGEKGICHINDLPQYLVKVEDQKLLSKKQLQ